MPPGKPIVAKNTAGSIAFINFTFANPARLHRAAINWNALTKTLRKPAKKAVFYAVAVIFLSSVTPVQSNPFVGFFCVGDCRYAADFFTPHLPEIFIGASWSGSGDHLDTGNHQYQRQ